jgi:hypothetical protein
MASRFWVGGTGTWDASDTTHWAATSGGAGGQSVPGTADTATFDASSGGGTVTMAAGYNPTLQSITCGAFTGTLDLQANANNVTLTGVGGFSGTGSGTRTVKIGGTITLTYAVGSASLWNFGTTTNLTFDATGSTISFTGNSASTRTFAGGGLTYNVVSLGANSSGGSFTITGANTFGSFPISGPNTLTMPSSAVTTVSTAQNIAATPSAPVAFLGNASTISTPSGTASYVGSVFRGMTFSGGATFGATDSLDIGLNSGISISPPAGGGSSFGGQRVISG